MQSLMDPVVVGGVIRCAPGNDEVFIAEEITLWEKLQIYVMALLRVKTKSRTISATRKQIFFVMSPRS